MRIEVTAEDIKNGVFTDCRSCPVALALDRHTGDWWSVGTSTATRIETGARFLLPPSACRWIHNFDCGDPVEPFSFELEGLN